MSQQRMIEVWIKGKFVTVVPAENESNVREDLESRHSGNYLIKPHKSPEERKAEAAPIFQKIDLIAMREKAAAEAEKEKEQLKTKNQKKKNETIGTN